MNFCLLVHLIPWYKTRSKCANRNWHTDMRCAALLKLVAAGDHGHESHNHDRETSQLTLCFRTHTIPTPGPIVCKNCLKYSDCFACVMMQDPEWAKPGEAMVYHSRSVRWTGWSGSVDLRPWVCCPKELSNLGELQPILGLIRGLQATINMHYQPTQAPEISSAWQPARHGQV